MLTYPRYDFCKNCHFYKILLNLDPKEILEGEKMEVETNEDIENETGFFLCT